MQKSAWLAVLLLGCGGEPGLGAVDGALTTDAAPNADAIDGSLPDAAVGVTLPPANAGLDYQLGGAYPPPAGVGIVVRDRTAAPAAGLYNICYVNGFQIQPDEEAFWMANHPSLILRDSNGDPVIDQDWDEILLDTRSEAKRAEIAMVVGGWITDCAARGYHAIEIDNLDSNLRSQGLIGESDNIAMMAAFAAAAHQAGVAIGQKNAAEWAVLRADLGTDFAVSEECSRYDECQAYVDAYGAGVLMIEYRLGDFDQGCADFPDHSIVLRDLDLVAPGGSGYVFDGC